MDALSVATQLRDLASEPQNREAVANDKGCLPGLVLFLDHPDSQVQYATLQTLRYLAEVPCNRTTMKGELGLMATLQKLMEPNRASDDITLLSEEVHHLLNKPMNASTPQKCRKSKPQFFINNSSRKAKLVTLHIHGLDNADHRSLCEEALLKVKGVISFTFHMALKRCTVRICSDLATERLTSAIAATRVLSAQQVVKNEDGKEVVVPLTSSPTPENVPQKPRLPDYLPEDESPELGLDRAVSRTSAKLNTGGSWLTAAAGFLSNTFYW